jgi:siroheme decarboxylase
MGNLSVFDKRLCNELQTGLPIVARPFDIIADVLKCSENEVIRHTRELIKLGVIRRLGVSINWRAIGKASTLVAAHIEQEDLRKVIAAVNKLQGVSHNYLREHYYNLWFTLRADSQKELRTILKKLSNRFGAVLNSLPVVRVFKLDARFDATSDGKRLLCGCRTLSAVRRPPSVIDNRILKMLQGGLKAVKRPFKFIDDDTFENHNILLHIAEMNRIGVINRLGAMVNHNKLGFTANAMFVCEVEKSRVIEIGEKLAALGIVSHCYERKSFKGWPYNIFAMMHGRDIRNIKKAAEKFVRSQGLKKWELLPTAEKLKK